MERFPEQLLGKLAGRFQRFPLLLKFLDAREMLSVQVHPTAANASLLPAGETAKTEAWVVLESETKEPHLCGPNARYYCSQSAAVTCQQDSTGPPCVLHSEIWRRGFRAGRDGSRIGRRYRGL